MEDEVTNQRQENVENISSSENTDEETSDDSSTKTLTYKSLSSDSSSQEKFYDVKPQKSRNDSSTGDELMSTNNSSQTSLTSVNSYDNDVSAILRDLSSESSPSIYDGSSPPRTTRFTSSINAHASLGPDQPPLTLPHGSLSGFLEVVSSNTSKVAESDKRIREISSMNEIVDSPMSEADGISMSGIQTVANWRRYIQDLNDSNSTSSANSMMLSAGGTSSSDIQTRYCLDMIQAALRETTDSDNSDDGASINDRYVLNPDTPDTASIHLSDLSDDSELARVVGVRQIDEYERQPGDPETSTLTSSTSFFSSDSGSSSDGSPAVPRRRTNLLYKAVLPSKFAELSQTLDPDVLDNGEPANRLEDECLCDECLAKIDDKVATCLAFLFKVFRSKCPKCNYEDRIKEYQVICYACSRVQNICFHCGEHAVVDNKDVLNFYSLFNGEHDREFFNSLCQEQKRHIIYQIYREWDTATHCGRLATVKTLLEEVLNNLQQCEGFRSTNPPI